jgi:hypothetical protein
MKLQRYIVSVSLCSLAFAVACGGGSSTPTNTGGGGGGIGDYTTCNSQQVPNWRSSAFQSNYQAAMKQLISHYGSNPSIGYIRIGFGIGGEVNLPQGWNTSTSGACYAAYTTTWGYTSGADATYTWDAYLQSMIQYEATLGSPKPLIVSLTPVANSTAIDDFIASVAVSNSISFGNQGLEASDIANYPNCGGDWCNIFARYPATPIHELQTIGPSCPEGTTCVSSIATLTGPLDPLIPFATAHGGNDLELYYADWLIAYDPAYAASAGATADSAAYQAAIQKAAAISGVSVQVLFPPQPANPDYSAVQQYLMSNPAVTGTVIDVDWSDMDIGNATAGTHTTYDFTISDTAIQPWIAAGKKVNLVFQSTTYGGGANCPNTGIGSNGSVGNNCAMPPWMWTVLTH